MLWLVDLALKSSLILGIAGLGAALLRRRSAATRHLWWCAAVAALAALPLFMAALPEMGLAVPASLGGETLARFAADAVAPADHPQTLAAAPALPTAPQPAPRTWDWRQVLLMLWAAGALVSLLRLGVAHVALARLHRRESPLADATWTNLLAAACAQLGVETPVRLLRHAGGGVPMTAGWLNPVIHLPAEADTWDDERRRVVLLHELAHVRRRDALTGALARLVLCVYWFHPLAWLAAREFLQNRERAADDLVLAAGATPSGYARHLLEIAAVLRAPSGAASAAVCMTRSSQLEGRLVAILDARLPRAAARPALAAAAVLAAVLATAPLAAVRAQSAAPAPAPGEMDALIRKALSARDHATLEFLAAELVRQHQYPEADRLSAAALEMRSQRFGGNSKEFADGLVAQGDLLRREGKWQPAENAYAQAAAIQTAAGAPDAATTGFLALSQYRQRHFAKAIELYQQALRLSPQDKIRARLLGGLAAAEADAGMDTEAETHFRAALAAAPDGTTDSATVIELYSRFLKDHSRADEARPIELRAAAVRKAAVSAGNTPVPAGEEPLKVGDGVQKPRLVHKVEPHYTDLARAARVQGPVKVNIVIGPDGKVHTIDLVQGVGLGLDEQAADAIRQWDFEPARLNGTAVAVKATIEVNFRLM